MEWKRGAILGLLAAVTTVVLGIVRDVPAIEVVGRSALAAVTGVVLGGLVFGRLGAALTRKSEANDGEKREG